MDPSQSGFAHGFAVFETILVADGLIQFWKAHWERLNRSAQTLGVELSCDGESALVAVRELLAELNGGLMRSSSPRSRNRESRACSSIRDLHFLLQRRWGFLWMARFD